MSQRSAEAIRWPRADTRPLDDILFDLDSYWAVLVAHEFKLFPLLAAQPCTLTEGLRAVTPRKGFRRYEQECRGHVAVLTSGTLT